MDSVSLFLAMTKCKVGVRKILCFGFTLASNLVSKQILWCFWTLIWQMRNILSPFEVGVTLFCSVAAAGNVNHIPPCTRIFLRKELTDV